MRLDALRDLRPPCGGPQNSADQQYFRWLVDVVSDQDVANVKQLVQADSFQQAVRYDDAKFVKWPVVTHHHDYVATEVVCLD